MNKEQKEIRKAELIATLSDTQDVLNELLAYSREGLSVSTIVEYANLFTILNDREDNKSYSMIELGWLQYEAPFSKEDELQEQNCQTADYDVAVDRMLAWEEHELIEKRNKQLQEIAIQAALEGITPNTREAFIKEYELNDKERKLFENTYYVARSAAEGRNIRRKRRDFNSYYAYEVGRDKELNAWAEDNEIVRSYDPNTRDFRPFDWDEFWDGFNDDDLLFK